MFHSPAVYLLPSDPVINTGHIELVFKPYDFSTDSFHSSIVYLLPSDPLATSDLSSSDMISQLIHFILPYLLPSDPAVTTGNWLQMLFQPICL